MLAPATLAQADQDKNNSTELAKSSGCFECHGSVRSLIGPTFSEISERNAVEKSGRNDLFLIIKNGGKAKWTAVSKGVTMPPFSGSLTDDEIQSLVDWILEFQK